jgi:hypothetical protein
LEKSDPASEPRSLPGVVALAFGVEGRSPKTKATRSSIAFLSLPVLELAVVVYYITKKKKEKMS